MSSEEAVMIARWHCATTTMFLMKMEHEALKTLAAYHRAMLEAKRAAHAALTGGDDAQGA